MLNLTTLKRLTRIEHSLFGLPFVLSGALLSFVNHPIVWQNRLLAILPAFLFARIAGMAFNQLTDRKIDAQNPRTADRVIPSGKVSVWQAAIIAWGSLFSFVILCSFLGSLCFAFSLVAAALLFAYAYTKRMGAYCHFVLGSIHLLGPIMAFIALTGRLSWAPFFLGLASLLLTSANDVIYALQDIAFDTSFKLHSIPAKLGARKALLVARWSHILCIIALCIAVPMISWRFLLAPIASAATLVVLHKRLPLALGNNRLILPLFFWSYFLVGAFTLLAIVAAVL